MSCVLVARRGGGEVLEVARQGGGEDVARASQLSPEEAKLTGVLSLSVVRRDGGDRDFVLID
ncbi:hypothetical protein A2U01_0113330 [Trifolium medium]|uniref:Uncharacterized protein n=1 Tax=Trifolium medium TaxID=97028 RepID=A0A392VUF6_9FABA|nr:hypothetical protein [Trifolium medium]